MTDLTTERTALVLGASMAGMWTARVLADHFDQVLLVERDRLPTDASPRPGAPQARQYHILLLRGLQIMHALFPGLEQELIASGAVPFDITGDVRLRSRGKWLAQFPSGQQLLSCSRLLLEATMRRRLRQDARICLVEGADVIGLETDAAHTTVTGVRIKRRRAEAAQPDEETLRAALVVDALGRRSPTPEWLVDLGYTPPEETIVDSFLGYVTRRYRQPDNFQADWRMMLITATPPHDPRGGLIFPEENGVWVVMMAGANKVYPPTDEAGFLEFARALGSEYYAAVQAATPISSPIGYRGTDSRWRHYEKLERWPERYVVLGDAFCGFNPIYGQGMTVAALSAVALGEEITRSQGKLDGVARRAERAFGKLTAGAWLLATGADLEWPGTVGGERSNNLGDRFGRWYIDKVLDAVAVDPHVRIAFNEVNQLVSPVTRLFAPDILWRVLKRSI
ncbi:MAG TPA: 2-polyprenyl-6-methoxyphenol hydroxylase-like oxidoreductase [Chloroflexi bacterium]|nr:2-polyprenyl-6-methoxyphenol hydroxylase-like oxidoreductase [Chloroflexota bacterium]HHW86222.1 2-polyprenyl-6-methoxyphenol hydroxylase-like oxidoreductase [Chloroflexota bacterium]